MKLRGLVAALLAALAADRIDAGANLNEVGAFLVYPAVVALDQQLAAWETFVTITNAGGAGVVAHVAYINGDSDSNDYCDECDFDVQLTGNDTETLVVANTEFGIVIESEDGLVSQACPHPFGMMTVDLENLAGEVLTDNVLLGSEVVVNYTSGYAYSIAAIPLQGRNGGNGDRSFQFDDLEYAKLPRIIAADFLAPDLNGASSAWLTLFTLGFDRGFPPRVDCSVTGYDASENPFSRSLQFGCWTLADLCDIHPEFCYPNLSGTPCAEGVDCDTHGWLKLNCRVDQDASGDFEVNGGVHGVLIQLVEAGGRIRRNDSSAPQVTGTAAWARLLFQSVTPGGDLTLRLADQSGGLD